MAERFFVTVTNGKTTRRAMLGAGAAFTIVNPGAVRGTQANSKISVGLIGAGNRGSYDASIVHADPRARITALCDLFDDQIERAKQRIKVDNPRVYKDFQQLLAAPDIDAVWIASPVFEHPRMLEAAVAARKHIYCEKPAGADYEGCRRVMAAGRRQDPKKCLSFGFQQRYGPVYTEMYKALQAGEIGRILFARAYWIGGNLEAARRTRAAATGDPKIDKLRNWYASKDYSGDFIVEQDCHNFDDLHWFLGALPERAAGYGARTLRQGTECLDHLTLSFEFPGRVHVNFEAAQVCPPKQGRVGEEYAGSKGGIKTSRQVSTLALDKSERTVTAKRDITIDAVEAFLGRILSGDVENVAERSAQSTMIALLGRAALYSGREATWKGEFGA
jgi:predicted dehydrogenase